MRAGPGTCRHTPRQRVGLVCLCLLLPLVGCGGSRDTEAEVPARLLSDLRELHRQHRYKDMESLVETGRAGPLIDTLMAVDRLLAASRQLQQTAEKHIGPRAAVACDLGDLADYLGPFSRHVQIVSTRLEDDGTAQVAYRVGQRVPLERAEIRRVAGRWRYIPDKPDPALPRLLMDLTERMGRLDAMAPAQTWTEQAFIDEYAARIVAPLQAHMQAAEQ